MMQSGVQRAFGVKLRGFLGHAPKSRIKAFLAGIRVTALLQSSTATRLMVTGFAAGGLVELGPALAVMAGGQCRHDTDRSGSLVQRGGDRAGADSYRRPDVPARFGSPRDFGRVLIGLGLMLMTLQSFIDLTTPSALLLPLRHWRQSVGSWWCSSQIMRAQLLTSTPTSIFCWRWSSFRSVVRNRLAIAIRKIKRGVSFSKPGQTELLTMIERLQTNLRLAASLFMSGDERAARLLAAEKEVFRRLEADATSAHFERLRAGHLDTAETSTMHLDALRDLKNVNTHLVAAAASPVLENIGELLPSRIRQEDEDQSLVTHRRIG